MKNFNFLAEHIHLQPPLAYMRLNQGFGVSANKAVKEFYNKLGLLDHNGLDLKASMRTPTTACFDGVTDYAGEDGTGGRSVRILSNPVTIGGIEYCLEAIYYHLDEWLVKKGHAVRTGEIIGLTGNSGKYTTGPHLHFGLKPLWKENGVWQKDYQNGYKGAVDPAPFIVGLNWEKTPVDEKYGREKVWVAEFNMRFKNYWLHRQFFTRLKRHPDSITNRELNALVYGSWDFETVFLNPAMYPIWTKQTKGDYLAKKPFPKPFDQNPWQV